MALWCESLPFLSVPLAAAPKHVTFVYPFYSNHQFFDQQLDGWWKLPQDLRDHVSAIVVDDGSPVPASIPAIRPFPMRLFRIDTDVRWNWLAARNIGAHHADDGWLLLTDMDHVVPVETLRSVIWGDHDTRVIYAFSRREHTGQAIHPHSASFLMTKSTFWKVGGYDETLSGHYGTDGDWRRRCASVAPMKVLHNALVRHENVGDSSTTVYLRKQPEDARVKALVKARKPGWAPKVLSFPYHEVLTSQAVSA